MRGREVSEGNGEKAKREGEAVKDRGMRKCNRNMLSYIRTLYCKHIGVATPEQGWGFSVP